MTPRRQETSLPMDEAPVRFYKFIALTFLAITVVLLGLIVFMSSKRATIEITTKQSPVDVTLGMILGADADVDAVVTTTIVTYQDTFEPTGDRQVEGSASGVITIVNESGTPQPLVATTRFLTTDDVLFRLDDGVTVPANSSVEAFVTADEPGKSGDVGPTEFTIPGLNENRQKQVYAQIGVAMSGGISTIGVLSEPDIARAEEQLKQRAVEDITAALGTDQEVLVHVVNMDSTPNEKIGEEVTSFRVSAEIEIVSAVYEKGIVQSYADASLKQREIDDTEIIAPLGNEPVITFDSYNEGENSVTASVFHTGLAMLNAESKQLDKLMFFGKTKDEVRRYLLSLDHVHSVDVKFSPGWIRTVPHVHDHVHVMVKEVK